MRDIPIGLGSAADRLRRLEQLSLKAEQAGDLALAARCIELAAAEQRAELSAAQDQSGTGEVAITPDEAREELARFLETFVARRESEGRLQQEADAGPGERAGLPSA